MQIEEEDEIERGGPIDFGRIGNKRSSNNSDKATKP
jgi:hypothetical protein